LTGSLSNAKIKQSQNHEKINRSRTQILNPDVVQVLPEDRSCRELGESWLLSVKEKQGQREANGKLNCL
jgi:hypothetical protein